MSLHFRKELLAAGGCQERAISLRDVGALAPVDGPAPICMQAVPIKWAILKKKRGPEVGKGLGGQDPGGTGEVIGVAYTAHMCEILNE